MPFFGYLYHAKKKSLRGLILSCQIAVSVSPTLAYLSRLSDLGYHFPQHSKKAKKKLTRFVKKTDKVYYCVHNK